MFSHDFQTPAVPTGPTIRSFIFFALCMGSAIGAGAEKTPVAAKPGEVLLHQGQRYTMDLAGTWEACPALFPLAWPPPTDGWKPDQVPLGAGLISGNDIGPYYPEIKKVVDDQGHPTEPGKAAAWYRRHFSLTPPSGSMRALLHCDGIAWRSDVFVNGKKAGSSLLGMTANVYDVTNLVHKGDNELAIGVSGRAALWNQEQKCFIAPIAGISPGIYDRVHLEYVPETYIEDVFVRTSVAKKRLVIVGDH